MFQTSPDMHLWQKADTLGPRPILAIISNRARYCEWFVLVILYF